MRDTAQSGGSILCRVNLAYKGGEPLRFAKHLANYGFDMLIREEVKGVSFFIDHEDGVFCLIMPLVSFDGSKVGVVVFYDVKARLGPDVLHSTEPLHTILAEWRIYCRAYVHAEIRGDRVVVLDHDATRNAASSLARPFNYVPDPDLRKLDEALGTRLYEIDLQRQLEVAARGVTMRGHFVDDTKAHAPTFRASG